MIFPPQGYKNISYKWLNQGMIFRPHGSYSAKVSGTTGSLKQVAQLMNEMQRVLWDQQPSTMDKHIAGKLTLCLGLPVMIWTNYVTELCMTRGQEGYVHGWQTTTGSQGQWMLDTLFVKLKPPHNHTNRQTSWKHCSSVPHHKQHPSYIA